MCAGQGIPVDLLLQLAVALLEQPVVAVADKKNGQTAEAENREKHDE